MVPVDVPSLRLPASLLRLLGGAPLLREEAGRSEAQVLYCPAKGGMYLKIDRPGALRSAALMQDFFHKNGLSAPLAAYESGENDYLLVCRVPGENGISARHLGDPGRLAASLGEATRRLHETPAASCPVTGLRRQWQADFRRAMAGTPRLAAYIADYLRVYTWENALREIESLPVPHGPETLTHGDLCLPNFMLDDFRFTGFIDLGGAGLGDRHYDLFWTLWSLSYNLGGDRFRDIFLDAYGRDAVDEDSIRYYGLLCSIDCE